jgi:hypothetical protein
MDPADSANSAASSIIRGSARIGAENFVPPTSGDWKTLAKRGGDPVFLIREGRAVLDASPILVTADGRRRCLDTEETIGQRQSARVALAASLAQHAGLTRDSANSLVNALFVQQHPDDRYAGITVLDPQLLRVAVDLFAHHETARQLASFTARPAVDWQPELLELERKIVSPDSNSSSTSLSQAAPQALLHAFSVCLLAYLRLARTTQLPWDDSTRGMVRAGMRAADAETIGALLAELKRYADTIYGPTEKRDFTALAEDMATVRMPEEFIRDTQIMAARISEATAEDRPVMDALEELASYVIARQWTSEMRAGLMREGSLDLSNGKPMSIRDDEHAKEILRSVVKRVNEIACREYDIALLLVRFEPREGEVSKDKQTAGEYNIERQDIYLNLDYVLKEPGAGNPEGAGPLGLIGTLAHEITHAYQHALALGTTKHRLPPAFRDAGAIFDFNFTNYAPQALVFPAPYRRQPVERHAHYVGYTVQRNLEYALRDRGARRGLGQELSEERSSMVNAWSLSSVEPNPKSPPESERKAMSRGAIFPRDPDTIPPWQRSAEGTGKPGSVDQGSSKELTDSDTED